MFILQSQFSGDHHDASKCFTIRSLNAVCSVLVFLRSATCSQCIYYPSTLSLIFHFSNLTGQRVATHSGVRDISSNYRLCANPNTTLTAQHTILSACECQDTVRGTNHGDIFGCTLASPQFGGVCPLYPPAD